jgi:hypothetical protein
MPTLLAGTNTPKERVWNTVIILLPQETHCTPSPCFILEVGKGGCTGILRKEQTTIRRESHQLFIRLWTLECKHTGTCELLRCSSGTVQGFVSLDCALHHGVIGVRRFETVTWSHIKGSKCPWKMDTGHFGTFRQHRVGHSFVIQRSRWQHRVFVALPSILSALLS